MKILACALLLVLASHGRAEVFKTIGPDGKVQYSDKAPEDKEGKTQQVKIQPAPAPDPRRPAAPRPDMRVDQNASRREWERRQAERASAPDPYAGESAECRKAQEYRSAAREGRLTVRVGNGTSTKVDENNAKLFDNDVQVYCKKK